MSKYKSFIDIINESNSIDDITDYSNQYTELKDKVKKMINDTINKSGGNYEDFIDKYIKSPDDTKISGLINDSDLYEFYLKYRNDIDELLNDIKFYDDVPSELNVFGLYDYIIKGTSRATTEIVKMLKNDAQSQ